MMFQLVNSGAGRVVTVVPSSPEPLAAALPAPPATCLSAKQILGAPGSESNAADPAAPAGGGPPMSQYQ
eukprot:7206034-Pyramimonas_sp.AAC.1